MPLNLGGSTLCMTAHSLQSPKSFSLTVRVVTGNAKPKHSMTGPISKKHSGQRLELRTGRQVNYIEEAATEERAVGQARDTPMVPAGRWM